MNTSSKTKKETSSKPKKVKDPQLTELPVPVGGINLEVRIADIEQELFDEDETPKRTSYRAILYPDGTISAIYNDRGELCSIKDLKALDPKANIFSKAYRQYYIKTYGSPRFEVNSSH